MTAPRSLALAAPEGPAATSPAEPDLALPWTSVMQASAGGGDIGRDARESAARSEEMPDPSGTDPARRRQIQAGFAAVVAAAVGAEAPSPQPPPNARIRPTVAWYCAALTCTATRRFASSLRRASSSSSWLTRPLR